MRLRDHDQPCEQHGLSGVHSYDVMTHPDGSTVAEFCPGGREITINYEAAAETIKAMMRRPFDYALINDAVDAVVAAALGVTE